MVLKMSKFNLNVDITNFDYLCKEVILKIQLSFKHHRVNKYVLNLNCLSMKPETQLIQQITHENLLCIRPGD